MSVALITGSGGLIGSEAVRHFAGLGLDVVGIDNDMRREFFGEEASTAWMTERLRSQFRSYRHYDLDIRNQGGVFQLFAKHGKNLVLVIHAAAQPSHDWAARDPVTDFSVNANGTLTLLEATRRFAPDAVLVFMSTNKVYGDRPNQLPLVEMKTRWAIHPSHAYAMGIPEEMPIDYSMHSLFGASKVAADILVQEYGRYFGLKTTCFRAGCLTGPNHSGTQLHGFLSYLAKCAMTGTPYRVLGYKGKQVRDNIHSADLVRAFDEVLRDPHPGEVYNMGGGPFSNCSVLEAIQLVQELSGEELDWEYVDQSRKGDHVWYVSDLSRFCCHYPNWKVTYDVRAILHEIVELNRDRWLPLCHSMEKRTSSAYSSLPPITAASPRR